MKYVVLGAGAMGSILGGTLSKSGQEIDSWENVYLKPEMRSRD